MTEGSETFAPLQLQRVASSAPWSLVALVLMYAGIAADQPWEKFVGFGGAVVLTLVSYRAAKLRMVLGTDVIVVSWLGGKHYPWSAVDRFVVNDKGLAIKLRGGLEESVPAFPMGGWLIKTFRDSMLADLEQTRDRAERYRRRGRHGG